MSLATLLKLSGSVLTTAVCCTGNAVAESNMPPILGIGARPCVEVQEQYGFDHPVVISWVNGFLTGMESARISYLQIWGRKLNVVSPVYIAKELEWRCAEAAPDELLAVVATKLLEGLPSEYPEDEY